MTIHLLAKFDIQLNPRVLFLWSHKPCSPILGNRGHIHKMDRLEWYQDSEEELLIARVHVVLKVHLCTCVQMWKFECRLHLKS